MKKIMALLSALTLIATLTACSGAIASGSVATTQPANKTVAATVATQSEPTVVTAPVSVEYSQDDLNAGDASSAATTLKLSGDSIVVEGNGVTVDGKSATITAAGTYHLSGALNEGQIIVNTQDEEKVVIVLDGVALTSSAGASIYVANAKKTVITLAAGTENVVSSGAPEVGADTDAPNAAIFSHDDLTINGAGALTVNATYNHGIVSKDDLKITGGMITVNAAKDGVKGRNSIAVKAGTLTVTAGGDGLQSNNDQEAEEGYIAIEGGALTITAGQDGVQAETRLAISGGVVVIVAGGGSVNGSQPTGDWGMHNPSAATDTTESAKALKAGVDVTIAGGNVTVDAADDAINSNGSLTIGGGELQLASGDDGLHADAAITINGGTLTITTAYEGIESAIITMNNGTVHLTAHDDGINVAGGNDGSGTGGMQRDMFASCEDCHLYLNGGYVFVDALGDGIDANSAVDMTGGVVIVNGPTENMNGPLDYTGGFAVTGGFLVAVGSAGMAQAPDASSTQYAALVTFPTVQPGGTLVHIADASGAAVLTFAPTKDYQSVVLCSPELKQGETYTVYTGGNSTGAATDGLYGDGSYTGGAQSSTFTISEIVTGAGNYGGGMPGGMPGGGQRRPGGGPRP